MLNELENLDIDLVETKDLIRYGPRDTDATSTNGVSVDQEAAEANELERKAFTDIISNDPQVFELWMKHRLIADSIDRLHGLVTSL